MGWFPFRGRPLEPRRQRDDAATEGSTRATGRELPLPVGTPPRPARFQPTAARESRLDVGRVSWRLMRKGANEMPVARTVSGLAAVLAAASWRSPARHRLAQAPTPPVAPAAKPDPAFDAAKAAFDALPEPDRRAIQDALVWTGDYLGLVAGTSAGAPSTRSRPTRSGRSSRPTACSTRKRAAISSRRRGRRRTPCSSRSPATPLGDGDRRSRKAAAEARGERERRHPLAERRRPDHPRHPRRGGAQADLAALYERNLAIQAPGRKVTYKLQRPDFFVVSRRDRDRQVLHPPRRGAGRPARLLGRLRQGLGEGASTALVVADREQLCAVSRRRARRRAGAGRASRSAGAPVEPPRPAGPIATGLVVAPRRVLTSAAVAACPDTARRGSGGACGEGRTLRRVSP